MMLDCSQIERIAHTLSLVSECDVVPSGALRMSTPFSYPNGDQIDVFFEKTQGSFWPPFFLSDYGQTSMYLRSAQVEMEGNKGKEDAMQAILKQLNVRVRSGNLFVDIQESDPSDLSDAIFRLSQACMRISDFAAHQKLRIENPFREEVGLFLGASGFVPVRNAKLVGLHKNEVKVDFEVKRSLICVVSSLTPSAAHTSSVETFRKWYDLSKSGRDLITVFNSKSSTLKDADKKRLRDYSVLLSFPAEQKELVDRLAA